MKVTESDKATNDWKWNIHLWLKVTKQLVTESDEATCDWKWQTHYLAYYV
jgi:hypothetical protein